MEAGGSGSERVQKQLETHSNSILDNDRLEKEYLKIKLRTATATPRRQV
jgi:hypothetical protein